MYSTLRVQGIPLRGSSDCAQTIILSTTNGATLGGVVFTAGELVQYFPSSDTASIFFSDPSFSALENIDGAAVLMPEPGTGLLVLLGLAGLARYRRASLRSPGATRS